MRRLIRLHPMVIVAMVIGILGYLLDPFVGNDQRIGEKLPLGMLRLTFGLSSFLLDMLRQPVETYGEGPLDPTQFVALAAMLTGGLIFASCVPVHPTSENPDMGHPASGKTGGEAAKGAAPGFLLI